MNQTERLDFLLDYLLYERPLGESITIPPAYSQKRNLLRALMNIRPPRPLNADFLAVQDAFLQAETAQKGVVGPQELVPVANNPRLVLWRGDITRLAVDAIVNAANSQMRGCFVPNHNCIDNAIHSAAGLQLRQACHELMERQAAPEATGTAKITLAFNLPCRFIIHTVGPIVNGELTVGHCELLRKCYLACLQLAAENRLNSIAFCCISTGEFRFPKTTAAQIALDTVKGYLKTDQTLKLVVFNVFINEDLTIYQNLL